jgi:RsiW-degrading membrane proteinase PrsW (M82 family)
MGLLASAFIGFGTALFFAYILYWLDRYEKEPVVLLGVVFLWGVVVAAGAAFVINTTLGLGVYMFTQNDFATEFTTSSLVAPLVEETLKGLAVLAVFLVFRREFDSVLDGIIYAGVAALGFAATENTYYIYTYGYLESGWSGVGFLAFVRVFLVGWQHPFYTAFIGIGLAVARLNRNGWARTLVPLLGWAMAMFTHSVHNGMATFLGGIEGLALGALVDWTGWLFMFGVLLWATHRERTYLRLYLSAEVQAGTITPAQARTAVSGWLQMFARLAALFSGRFLQTTRFYQVCGEYAHKRQQYATLGEEGGTASELHKLRVELASLAPFAQVVQ